jgi:CheY-like chemotaxis protein
MAAKGVLRTPVVGRDTRSRDATSAKGKQVAKRIAIVDDEPVLSSLFSTLIKNLGYREEFVTDDGSKIVKAVLENGIRPDLILMDHRMPVMNGLPAAERILKAKPWIKIILATADDSVTEEAKAAGVLVLRKPFTISALARTIEEALDS